MKTTIDIPDRLFEDLKQAASKKKTTIKAIVEASLRMYFASQRKQPAPFKLKDGSVRGHGLQPGIREGDWEQLREIIYEGRGG